MTGLADDHIQRLSQLQTNRIEFERAWRQVKTVAAPEAEDFSVGGYGMSNPMSMIQRPEATALSKDIYDGTAIWAVDRLGSGIESLVMPQSDFWHGYTTLDFTTEEPSDDTKMWFERLRNLTFKMRYDPDGQFIPTAQIAIRRCIAFGNAFFEVEDGIAGQSVFRYSYIPLNQSYAATDKYDIIDSFYRPYTMTARQARQKFGDKLSPNLIRASESPTDADRSFLFVKCIHPRADYGRLGIGGVKDAAFASIHIEYESRKIVGESGYYEFPIIDFRWMPEPGRVYGEGPIMKALSDIQTINAMAKNELIASHQQVSPTLLVANAGVMNRPKADPGKVILGGMNAQGQRMVEPLMPNQRLDFAQAVIEAKRVALKESLYINLFAILIRNPEMSATEAMIRSNEKGELLGPAGSRFQMGLSRMNQRELGIMSRRGVFAQNSAFAPPREVQGKKLAPSMSSPLDRYRLGKEVEGTMQLLNTLSPLAQVDPTVVDNINGNEMTRGLADRLGVPAKFINTKEAVAQLRAQRDQANQMAQQAAVAKDMAAASKSGVEAMAAGQQAGII